MARIVVLEGKFSGGGMDTYRFVARIPIPAGFVPPPEVSLPAVDPANPSLLADATDAEKQEVINRNVVEWRSSITVPSGMTLAGVQAQLVTQIQATIGQYQRSIATPTLVGYYYDGAVWKAPGT